MSSSLRVLPCALLAGALLASPAAEARFGKSSDSSDDSNQSASSQNESRSSDSHVHDATPVNTDSGSSSGRVHDASPVGTESQPHHHSSEGYYPPPPPPVYEPGYVPPPSYVPRSSWEDEFTSRRHRNFTLGLEGNLMREGGGVGLHLGVEGERLGGFLRLSALSLRAEDGSGTSDNISVTGVHLSWALLKGHWGRLRVEGGVSVAKAPDVTFVGPSVGLSGEVYLLNSLALEARTQVTPFPYRQLDAAGGAVWYLGTWRVLALRAGMRVLMLDDAGWVDGVAHQDVLPGPYVSFGLAI